eukprot:TRINITY_DN309_c0_g1_i3.p1 TRINITY_DN309_c0_g1~~TRINITY_DN309_c0_g1_i3.p1  ORF type:complete len:495 (-),score=113.89 TRINITY_DN309_c0_g1_i3:117-1601(-)
MQRHNTTRTKKQVTMQQNRAFFDRHKGEEWFRERFDPIYIIDKRNEKILQSKSRREELLTAYASGDFEIPKLDEEAPPMPDSYPIAAGPSITAAAKEGEEAGEVEEGEEPEGAQANEPPKTEVKNVENAGDADAGPQDQSDACTIYVRAVAPSITRATLLSEFSKFGHISRLVFSSPNALHGFRRRAWVTYKTAQEAAAALAALDGQKVDGLKLKLELGKITLREKSVLYFAGEEPVMKKDLEVAKRLTEKLDREKGIEGPNPMLEQDPSNLQRSLDAHLSYLRKVHLYCYYCADEFDDETDMERRCGTNHFRGAFRSSERMNVFGKRNLLDSKNQTRLSAPDELKACGLELEERYCNKAAENHFTQINPEKFRCNECRKAFVNADFTKKHIRLKHPELVAEAKLKAQQEQFFNNFVEDPHHSFTSVAAPSQAQGRNPRDGIQAQIGHPQDPYAQRHAYGAMHSRLIFESPQQANRAELIRRVTKSYVDLDNPS